mgnify:CR=1 FL=1
MKPMSEEEAILQMELLGHEFYMYAKNTKLDITFPIEHIQKIEAAMQDVNGLVTIADKVFISKKTTDYMFDMHLLY